MKLRMVAKPLSNNRYDGDFRKLAPGAEALAKFQETGSRFDAAVRNIGGEII